jgi:hypothetical protein
MSKSKFVWAVAVLVIPSWKSGDTATSAEFYGATITFPRLLAAQAN